MGLAKSVAGRFPEWGQDFAALMYGMVSLPHVCMRWCSVCVLLSMLLRCVRLALGCKPEVCLLKSNGAEESCLEPGTDCHV